MILPSSFTGGPSYIHEYAQDTMTYVRNYGRPDIFITFTCSPQWSEVTAELVPGQAPQDHHDILARVFHQRAIKFMGLITEGYIFGHCSCYMYSMAWQNKSLPHIHILVWLTDKIRPHQIDSFISAEIPNSQDDPLLHHITVSNMLRGPCGHLNCQSPCMRDGKCTKRYARPLLHETQTGQDRYSLYRRR